MQYVINRVREPSSWAGCAAIAQAMKLFFPAHAVWIDGVTAAAGAVAVVLREQGGAQ